VSAGVAARRPERTFRHDALLYSGEEEFVAGALAFIGEALAAGDPVLVVVGERKLGLLRSELGADAEGVQFADMGEVGANPARIIPAWRQFTESRAEPGRRAWGIGEPIWAGRSDAEIVEAQRHEALLNLAFSDDTPLSLLCPYDVAQLDGGVIDEAQRTHPGITHGGASRASRHWCGLEELARPFADPLPEPHAIVQELAFSADDLADVRRFVARRARQAGMGQARRDDLVLALNEIATNSVRHAGGRGTLRAWYEPGTLICEVRDEGRIEDPLAGRRKPRVDQVGGYGLWLANQVCDLVQVRSYADGTAVRVHMRRS
jgi:anti-sigma regulatory factor (Ser/Thr protein kinase)